MMSGRKKLKISLALLIVLAGYAAWALLRPLPPLKPVYPNHVLSMQASLQTPTSKLVWPSSQAALGIAGTGILETHGEQKPVPTASTAKIITALMVLNAKPLALGQQGPAITLTANDVAIYNAYVAHDGSVVPVQAGEQITEYQALEALMLPSANNIADSLAIWAYGSLANYSVAANDYLGSQGMAYTHVGSDASGLAADSTSTANDLAKLGLLAIKNPVLQQIVGKSTATDVPLTHSVKNVNSLLGLDGIIGVKTGNSDHVGGAFVGAATATVNGKPQTIVTAVTDAPDLTTALKQSRALIQTAQANFPLTGVVFKGDALSDYKTAWGATVKAIAAGDLSQQAWQGGTLDAKITLNRSDNTPTAGETVGSATITDSTLTKKQTVAIKLAATPPKPTLWWRLSHPF